MVKDDKVSLTLHPLRNDKAGVSRAKGKVPDRRRLCHKQELLTHLELVVITVSTEEAVQQGNPAEK